MKLLPRIRIKFAKDWNTIEIDWGKFKYRRWKRPGQKILFTVITFKKMSYWKSNHKGRIFSKMVYL